MIDLEKEEDRTRLTYTERTLLQSADDEGSFVGLPYVLLSMACVPRAKVLNDCVRVALVEGILKRDQKWAVEGVDHGLQHRPGSAIQCVFADVPWEGSVSISTVSKGTNASYTLIYVSSMTTKTGRLACPTCTVHHRILPLDRYEDRKGKNVIKNDYDGVLGRTAMHSFRL